MISNGILYGLLAENIFDALGITVTSVLLHLLNLAILTVGLYFLLFKPVKKMVRERREKKKKIERENTELNEEVKKLMSNSEEVLNEAKREAAEIHENAVRVANQKADGIIGDAKATAKSLLERTEKELDEEREKLSQEIEKQITDVSFVVAEKVLARDIKKEDNERMIEECLNEWSKK